MKEIGEPDKDPVITLSGENPAPSGPEYLVKCISLDRLDRRFVSNQISIIDFGESYDMLSPSEDLGITTSFRSPELLLEKTVGIGCDLWALACTIYQVRTKRTLFENWMDDEDEVIMQIIPISGKLPEHWWSMVRSPYLLKYESANYMDSGKHGGDGLRKMERH